MAPKTSVPGIDTLPKARRPAGTQEKSTPKSTRDHDAENEVPKQVTVIRTFEHKQRNPNEPLNSTSLAKLVRVTPGPLTPTGQPRHEHFLILEGTKPISHPQIASKQYADLNVEMTAALMEGIQQEQDACDNQAGSAESMDKAREKLMRVIDAIEDYRK